MILRKWFTLPSVMCGFPHFLLENVKFCRLRVIYAYFCCQKWLKRSAGDNKFRQISFAWSRKIPWTTQLYSHLPLRSAQCEVVNANFDIFANSPFLFVLVEFASVGENIRCHFPLSLHLCQPSFPTAPHLDPMKYICIPLSARPSLFRQRLWRLCVFGLMLHVEQPFWVAVFLNKARVLTRESELGKSSHPLVMMLCVLSWQIIYLHDHIFLCCA